MSKDHGLHIAVLVSSFFLLLSCQKGTPSNASPPNPETLVIVEGQPVTDHDGNVYRTIKIGNQTWTAENLRSTHFSDGTSVQSFCYNNEIANAQQYGRLYRWAAAMRNAASSNSNPSRVQGVSPAGWHLPSDAEWQELINNLGGSAVAGGKLKTTDTLTWLGPNAGATNESKFNAIAAGFYRVDDVFMDMRERAIFMTATGNSTAVMVRTLRSSSAEIVSGQFHPQDAGSVRCVKD
jgi:uncharacterized protein (TIGR02145 family)